MLYVAMTRGRDDNQAYIYQRLTGESDHDHTAPVSSPEIHRVRRGDKYCAAHAFRMILGHDDRPRTMHAEAERTPRQLLPDEVSNLLRRHDQRLAARRAVWREHTATTRARQAAYERIATAGAERDFDVNGLDL